MFTFGIPALSLNLALLMPLSATPEVQAPPPPIEDSVIPAGHLPVHFTVAEDSERTELFVYLEAGVNSVLGPGESAASRVFKPLCKPPCDAKVRPGLQRFGVSLPDTQKVIRTDQAIQVKRGDTVSVRYDRRFGLRVAGWVILLGGVGAGSTLVGIGSSAYRSPNTAMVVSGSVLTALSLVSGLWVANLPDRASAAVVR